MADPTAEPTMSLVPVDAPTHAPLIHAWVTQPRASYWGMLDKDLEEVEAIYGWIQDQPHLAAYLIHLGDVPVGIFQTYDPFVDEIGEFYDRRPGDLGCHLFLADEPARIGRTKELTEGLLDWLFAQPGTERVVVEPDANNAKSIALFLRLGATLGPIVDLPHKTAQFAFFTR